MWHEQERRVGVDSGSRRRAHGVWVSRVRQGIYGHTPPSVGPQMRTWTTFRRVRQIQVNETTITLLFNPKASKA
mgnify:CR=1 FL=1